MTESKCLHYVPLRVGWHDSKCDHYGQLSGICYCDKAEDYDGPCRYEGFPAGKPVGKRGKV